MKYYIHIPNGDYNNLAKNKDDANGIIHFELNEGSQNFLLITKQKLSSESYEKIISTIEETLKNGLPIHK